MSLGSQSTVGGDLVDTEAVQNGGTSAESGSSTGSMGGQPAGDGQQLHHVHHQQPVQHQLDGMSALTLSSLQALIPGGPGGVLAIGGIQQASEAARAKWPQHCGQGHRPGSTDDSISGGPQGWAHQQHL